MHATSTNSECNIHEEVVTESSKPYRQLILDVIGSDFHASGSEFNAENMEEVPNPMHTSFMICLVQLIKYYGMVVLNIPRCQRLHDCCI